MTIDQDVLESSGCFIAILRRVTTCFCENLPKWGGSPLRMHFGGKGNCHRNSAPSMTKRSQSFMPNSRAFSQTHERTQIHQKNNYKRPQFKPTNLRTFACRAGRFKTFCDRGTVSPQEASHITSARAEMSTSPFEES